MNHYLLILLENSGGQEHITRHLIQAEDRQMVKYHFHRTLKEWGYSDTNYGKHCLEHWDTGIFSEIQEIRSLDPTEYEIMGRHLGNWMKE